jgi:hypothetical protein
MDWYFSEMARSTASEIYEDGAENTIIVNYIYEYRNSEFLGKIRMDFDFVKNAIRTYIGLHARSCKSPKFR